MEGRARPDGALDRAVANTVTPDYFETMEIPLVRGRTMVDLADTNAAPEVMANESFVRAYIDAGVDPIGRGLDSGGQRYTIVGIVKDSLSNPFGEPPTPALYFSYRDRPSPQGELHVRARAGNETRLADDVRRILRELDPALPLFNVRTLTDHVERNLVFRRIPARMFTVLGPLLLVLAATGIYAVVAHSVSQRRTEIGLRLALGAPPGRVIRTLVGETLRVVAWGAATGWIVAFVIDRDVSAGGPVNLTLFAGVPLPLLIVAGIACWLPAYRASRIDPWVALRQD